MSSKPLRAAASIAAPSSIFRVRTLAGAHKFAKLGQKTRKEQNTEQMMTRVSLLEMYKDGGLLPGNLFVLSSRESASSLLAPLYAIHGQLE